MKWHSLYQSVSHSVTAVVPEYWLPLRPAPLHTAVALPLGNSHSSPSCLFGPLRSSTSFYLNFTSCPFSVYYFLNSNSGSQRRGKGGKHVKRCGIFFIVLGTHGDPSQGTLPFPSRFFPSSALSLKASFFYFPMKSHSSLSSKPVSFSPLLPGLFTHLSVCASPLLSVLLKQWKW